MIAIKRLAEEPYASIICYPRVTSSELKKRLKELERLRVKALEFAGSKQVLNIHVLGKGCVGIVTTAYRDRAKIALKVRRVDADRSSMRQEAELLRKANLARVGPRLLEVSKNFLLMQFIDGELLPEWLEKQRSSSKVREVLRDVLEQCWRLDTAGLDHGELSHAPKHIIVDKRGRSFIVDFETASLDRRPSNVTSICQFLFMSGIAGKVFEKIGEKDKKTIRAALRDYKRFRSADGFRNVLEACGLYTT
jgi:putative serine/threonine protein kinase